MRDRIFRFLAYIFEKNDNRSVVACLIYDKYADRQVVHTEVFKKLIFSFMPPGEEHQNNG